LSYGRILSFSKTDEYYLFSKYHPNVHLVFERAPL